MEAQNGKIAMKTILGIYQSLFYIESSEILSML